MREKLIKSSFHALLAGVAVLEMNAAKSDFRKALCGAWCGFHAVLAVQDLRQ